MKAEGYADGKKFIVELETINDQGMALEVTAARWYKRMKADAAKDGIRLTENTAFRGMAWQTNKYNEYQAALKQYEAAKAAGKKNAKKPSPVGRPGYSTHQSGRSVDVNRAHDDYTNNGIADGETDKWLQANARKYGFKNDVASEPWHWTFFPILVSGKDPMGLV